LLPMRVFVDAVLRGPPGARGVALTFDDGPDEKSTPRVLDVLDAHAAKATFFVIAKKAESQRALMRDMIARGHKVALHSYAHDRLFSLRRAATVRADLDRGIKTLEDVTGARTSWFRPPIGHTNPVIARVCDELDLRIIGWSVSARDGTARAREDECCDRVRAGLRNGAIVLMHDAAERGERMPLAPTLVPKVLDAIAAANLSVASLSSWVEDRD
jgi:peptidoglycan-N-acetylglucosamine deacetylase